MVEVLWMAADLLFGVLHGSEMRRRVVSVGGGEGQSVLEGLPGLPLGLGGSELGDGLPDIFLEVWRRTEPLRDGDVPTMR